MILSEQDRDDIYHSLSVRLGYIETGTNMRAIDAKNCGYLNRIKVLSSDQMELVLRLEKLMSRLLNYNRERM